MPVYEVDIPGQGTFRVNSRRPLAEDEVIAAVQQQLEASAPQAPVAPPVETNFGGQVKEFFKGIPAGFVGTLGTATEGLAALLPEEAEKGVVGATRRVVDALSPDAAVGYEDSVGRNLGQALGSIGSFVIPGGAAAVGARALGAGARGLAATRIGTTGVLGGAAGAGEARQRAEAEGATADEKAQATALGILPGLTELLPAERILGRFFKPAEAVFDAAPPGLKSRVLSRVKDIFTTAGIEAAQEAAQGFAQNLIAQGVYKPEQDLIEGLGEQAAYGGAAGAMAEVILGMALGRRASTTRNELEKKAREEEALAAQESAAAEKARMLSPEYRQEINAEMVALKDELREIESIAKDKAAPPEVRQEAMARAKEIRSELGELDKKMKGATPAEAPTTLEDFRARRAQTALEEAPPIVDEFGNVVKPKKAAMTEEEYAAGYDKEAERMRERNELLRKLREKEEVEAEAKRQKVEVQTQEGVQRYLSQLDDLEEMNVAETVKRVASEQQRREEDVAQEMTLNRIDLVLRKFENRVLGLPADAEAQNIRQQIEKLSDEKSIAAAPDRNAQIQQIDELKAKLAEIVENAPTTTAEGFRRLINEGVVNRNVTKVLGIEGLEGRTYRGANAVKALPNITEAIDRLETQRQKALTSKRELMDNKGQLTRAGYKLVATEAKLNELKRLAGVIQNIAPAETGAEGAVAGTLETAGRAQIEPVAVEIQPGLPSVTYKSQAEEANKQAGGRFTDLTALMDDYRKGRFFGEKGAKRDIELASSTRESLLQQSEAARKDVVDSLIKEIAYRRMEQKLRPFTRDEAISFGVQIDEILKELINRSTALPSGYSLEKVYTPAKTRGAEIIRSATESLVDTRDLKDRQFGAPQRAVQVLAEMVKQAKEAAITAGSRSVRAERPLLKKQYAAPPTDLVKDLDRVLRMENLQPEVRDVLEQAQRRMEEGGASEGLEELVEEQVGRILRGTDRPFVLERDVTKPGGRRAMAAAGTAELIDEIQTQLRFDSELAQFAQGEQRTLVPSGKRFAEADVQSDLFPESIATARATPAQFQRLQKSDKVQKQRDAIAAEKAEKDKQEAEKQRQAREKAKIKRETSPAKQVEEQMQSVRNVLADVMNEYSAKKQAEIEQKNKQLSFLMKSVRTKALKQLDAITNTKTRARLAKDMEGDLSLFFPKEAELIAKLQKEVSALEEKQLSNTALLDKRVQAEVKFLKELEKKAELAAKGTPEQRRAQKQAALVRGQIVKAEQTLKEAKEKAADRASNQKAMQQTGLDLPGIRVTAKRRELAKGKGTVRRSKIVPIKTRQELEEKAAERRQQALVDLADRPFEKDELTAALKKIDRLSSGQRTTQTKLYLQAAADAKQAKENLEKYLNRLGDKAPNKQRIVALRNEVDETSKIVRELNRRIANEVSMSVRGLEEAAIPTRKATTRGPIAGEVKWYDKKFTPQQLEGMGVNGADAFGTKTYSVDDNIDFRVGDKEGGGISLVEANARMAEVEKKLPPGIKFKYFPTMGDVTMDILRNMRDQGMNVYENRIRGGVKPDGTVFVVGGNHDSMLDLEQTIAHEFIGHYTFEGMLGKDGMKKLTKKVENEFGSVFKLAEQLDVGTQADAAYVAAKHSGATDEQAKTTAMREIVAYTMEKRVDQKFMQKAKRWIQELVGALRAALKNVGLLDASKMSTSDLFYLMRQANESFESGRPIAYRNEDGSVSFRSEAPEEKATGIGSMIATRGKALDNIKGNLTGLNFRVQFVDRLAALEELVKKGVSKGIISSLKAYDVMYFNRMADQRNNFVAQFATNGVGELVNKNGEFMYDGSKGPSLKDVSKALNDSGIDPKIVEREFTSYLVALRARRVGVEKLDFSGKKVTKADVDATIAKYENNKAFNKAKELYQEYNDNLIDFVVSTGAMEKAKGDELKGKDYVPYYRKRGGAVELVISGEKFIRIGDLKNQPYLNELVGGETQVLPVFTGAIQNTSLLVDMALKNMATRNTAFVLQEMGVAKMNPGMGGANPNTIRFKRDGKDYHAVINTKVKEDLFGDIPTELVVTGMEGIKATMPAGISLLGIPATWLRRFVTRDPRYAIRQVFRDSMAAVLTTGADFTPVVDTFKEMARMKKSGAIANLQSKGVIGGQVITGSSDDQITILTQLASGKFGWEMAMAKLDELAMMGDAATRVSMYNSFIKQGLSEREATLATLEAMNFSRRGVSPSVMYANTLIPFFNAGVQGLDVLYRAARGRMNENERLRVKQKLIARGLMMWGFTFFYAAVMSDDETYENANPEERYGNWFVPTPVGTFRVPIPFELGLVFKGTAEGASRLLFSDDKAGDVADAMRKLALRSIPIDIPATIKPAVEIALNKSFFTDRPIVQENLEGLPRSMQVKPTTPEILKFLAELGIPPLQTEHVIRAYTGSLLIGLLRIPDAALGLGDVSKPTMRVSDVPILGGLFQPEDASGIINSAYNSIKNTQNMAQAYKRLAASDPVAARAFLAENLKEVSMASTAGRFQQQMGKITAAERAVRESRTLSSEQKREMLDKYRQMKIDLSKQIKKIAA
jgi:hypothetical protein